MVQFISACPLAVPFTHGYWKERIFLAGSRLRAGASPGPDWAPLRSSRRVGCHTHMCSLKWRTLRPSRCAEAVARRQDGAGAA